MSTPLTTTRPTVLGWPSPWSGDERDPIPARYRAWFRLYVGVMRLRHIVGLHAERSPMRCTWCGRVRS